MAYALCQEIGAHVICESAASDNANNCGRCCSSFAARTEAPCCLHVGGVEDKPMAHVQLQRGICKKRARKAIFLETSLFSSLNKITNHDWKDTRTEFCELWAGAETPQGS